MSRAVQALVVLAVVGACWAQYDDGPAPPRIQVLGAVPLGPAPSRGRAAPVSRVRRPQARQQVYLPTPADRPEVSPPPPPPPAPQTTLPPRPVAEEVEEYDDLDDVTSRPNPPPSFPSPPPHPSPSPPSFSASPPSVRQQLRAGGDRPIQIQVSSPIPISISDIPVQTPTRQQFRQQQPSRPAFRPERPLLVRPAQISLEDTPVAAPIRPQIRQQIRPQPIPIEDAAPVPRQQIRQQQIRPQQIPIEEAAPVARQQFRQQSRPAPQQIEQPIQRQPQQKPLQKQPLPYSPYKNQRERKPVAQVLNKYREDNPDGSITWGYENDDGSFKEETIGVDCVVRGKYGYVDPDGVRREYSYSSGIPCDKTKEKQQEDDQGYIDYQTNSYVLPNGDTIPIHAGQKNKGRRPAGTVPANYGK